MNNERKTLFTSAFIVQSSKFSCLLRPCWTAFEHPCKREWVVCRSEVIADADGEGEHAVGRAKCEGVGGIIAMSR